MKGALIDTYVAAASKDLFDNESIVIHEVNIEGFQLLVLMSLVLHDWRVETRFLCLKTLKRLGLKKFV